MKKTNKQRNKKQGYCIYAKQKGRDVVLYILWTYHVIGCVKGRASYPLRGLFSILSLGVLVKYSKNATVSIH